MNKILLLIYLLVSASAFAQNTNYGFSEAGCKVLLKNDTLYIENNLIKRTWLWNKGNIITLSLENKKEKFQWKTANKQADLLLPLENQIATNTEIKSELIPDSYQFVKHLRTTLNYTLGNLNIRKIIKIYPECPVIAVELFYKGKASKTWAATIANAVDQKNIETVSKISDATKLPVMCPVVPPLPHLFV